MQMPGRQTNTQDYRFGYNGMEKDKEIKGDGNSYTTEFRQYDPRLGRWLSLDPLMAEYSSWSPYVAFENNPVVYDDPLGLSVDGDKDQGGGEKKYTDSKASARAWIKENRKNGKIGVGAYITQDKETGDVTVHYRKKYAKSYHWNEAENDLTIEYAYASKTKVFKQLVPPFERNDYVARAIGEIGIEAFAPKLYDPGKNAMDWERRYAAYVYKESTQRWNNKSLEEKWEVARHNYVLDELNGVAREAMEPVAKLYEINATMGGSGLNTLRKGISLISKIEKISETATGNFGLGSASYKEAMKAGRAWVGKGSRVASDGKTLISKDGLRQFRPPSSKPRLGKVQANFESRGVPKGKWNSNGHLDIK